MAISGPFDIAVNDQSLLYLGQLFGDVGGLLPSAVGQLQLLGVMFTTINNMVLVVGSFILMYVIIVGLLKTAQEGEFLGKQWSSLWVPLRTVIGIVSLVPTATGYSMIQVVMMWIVIQGIGAADTLWTTVLQFSNVAGSPFAGISVPRTAIHANMTQLFQAITCQETVRAVHPEVYGNDNSPFYLISSSPKRPDSQLSLVYQFLLSLTASSYTTITPIKNAPGNPITNGPAQEEMDGTITYTPAKGFYSCGIMQYPNPAVRDNAGICQSKNSDARHQCRSDLQSAIQKCQASCPTVAQLCFVSPLADCTKYVEACNTSDSLCTTALHQVEEDNTSACTYAAQYKNDASRDVSTAQTKCATTAAQQVVLQSIISTVFVKVAKMLEEIDNQYIAFFENNTTKAKGYMPATVPQWIIDYCSDQGIPQANCCVSQQDGAISYKIPPPCTKTQLNAGYGGKGDTTCQDCGDDRASCPKKPDSDNPCYAQGSGAFPLDYDKGHNDYGNTSEEAVKLYWTYALQPQLQSDPLGDLSDFIGIATDQYVAALGSSTALLAAMATKPLQDWMINAQKTGWIFAGAYYYNLAGRNKTNIQASLPTMQFLGGAPTVDSVRNNFLTAKNIANSIAQSQNSGSNATPLQAASAGAPLSNTNGNTLSNFQQTLEGSNNPILGIAAEGESLIVGGETLVLVYFPVVAIIMLAASVNPMVLGFGLTHPILAELFKELFFGLNWLVIATAGFLISIGGVLAIYVPLIPYIIFVFGAIGWFFAVIEAIVAAPFVGLGILTPGGHEILGHAERSILMIFNTFLRPSLMVLGMMCSMLLAPIVVKMINSSFANAMGTINANPGPIEVILFLVAYTTLIVAALNKVFTLIYIIPNKVLTWIGGQEVSFGEGDALGEIKGKVDKGAGSVGSGMQSVGGQGSKANTARQKAQDKLDKKGDASSGGS
jgi:hypothetical protein